MVLREFPAQKEEKTTSGRVDRAFATKTIDLGLIPGRVQPNTAKTWYFQLPCLTALKETV